MPVITSALGFPRIGPRRELTHAVESSWVGKLGEDGLIETAVGLRAATWSRIARLGIRPVPSNDFSFYDHALDTAMLVGRSRNGRQLSGRLTSKRW